MDFKRGMNRKAQEGMTLTTLLAIIVGGVAVVVIVLFVTGFFYKLRGGTNPLPSDLQAAVTACEMYGSNGLTADYCSTFREVTINGEKQYRTCEGISEDLKPNARLQGVCQVPVGMPATFCKAQNLDKNVLVNDMHCSGAYTTDNSDDWARLAKY
jgi:hypothetical protein